jgi:carbohydrate-selective porin OprB
METEHQRSIIRPSTTRCTSRFVRLAAVFLIAVCFEAEAPAREISASAQEQQALAAATVDEAEAPKQSEWFGSGLPWWKWSTMTGDWGGWRSSLSEAGVLIEGANVMDWSRVASGGLRRRSTIRSLLDVRLTVDLKPLTGIDAGTVWARYYSFLGRGASKDSGDIQGFSNIDFDKHRHQLAELWYEQRFFNEGLRVKIGKVDANTEFAFAENAAEFMNSSMGFSPTVFAMPTYPDPAMSVNLFVYPTDHFYAGFAAYDGSGQRGVPTGSRGPSSFFRGLNRLFYIGEVGARWQVPGFELPGRLGVGTWHHNGSFERFNGGSQSSAGGFYMVLDHMIWRVETEKEDEPNGIGMYVQYGMADESVSEIKHHAGAGFVWRGPLAGREEDAVGAGVTWVRLSDAAGAGFDKNHEVALETFYKIQLTPWLTAKPDLQYIVNPSGARAVKNALVPGLRLEWTF